MLYSCCSAISRSLSLFMYLYINNKIRIVLLLLQCKELPTQCQGNLAYSSLTGNEDNVFIETSTLHVQMYNSNLLLPLPPHNTTTTKHANVFIELRIKFCLISLYCRTPILFTSLSYPFFLKKFSFLNYWLCNGILQQSLYHTDDFLQTLNFRSAKHNYVILQLGYVQQSNEHLQNRVQLMRFISFTLKISQRERKRYNSCVNHVFGKKLSNNPFPFQRMDNILQVFYDKNHNKKKYYTVLFKPSALFFSVYLC